MRNPPLTLLHAIHKAFSARQASAGAQPGEHGHPGLFHDGVTGSLPPPIIPALINQGGVGQQRWESGVVDIVIPLYDFYAQGDNVVLYVDDAYVDDQTVRDSDAQLVFAAPVRAFNPSPTAPDYQADVHYHTIDQLGGNVTASRSTLLPVKLTVPGAPPDDLPPGTIVNNNLARPVGVPAELTPVAGVDLPVLIPPYRYMAAGDVITLFWAGAAIPHPPLTADQVGSSITIAVPDTLIAAWPGDAREVRYSIRDRVQNYSLFSLSAYCNVAEQATLAAPILVGQVGSQFNPDTLAGGAALITVPGIDLLPGDRIVVHVVGQPLDWPYLHYVTEEQPFSGPSLTFEAPNPLVRSLSGSTLNLYYQVQRSTETLRSHSTMVQIVGTPIALPAPYIHEAAGGELVPPVGAVAVTVVVPLNIAFAPGSSVELRWLGIDGAGDEHLHSVIQPVLNQAAELIFKAPIAWVLEIAGGTLQVSYNLLAGGLAYGSEVLRHTVAGDASLLPVPDFDPPLSLDDELDLESLTGALYVLVDASNPHFAGGTATLAWVGSAASEELVIGSIPANSPPLRFRIDRARLIEPNLDQNVAVSYRILRRDGHWARSKALVLSVINSASLRWPKAQVLDASGLAVSVLAPVREISDGQWTENTATVVVTDARLRAGDTVDVFWKLLSGHYPAIPRATAENGQARITVPSQVLAESFGTAVKITYLATVSGVPAHLGEELELIVASVSKDAFPSPAVVESDNDDSLDLNTFTTAATVRVGKYPFMAVGQIFWLWMYSTRDDGSAWSMRLGSPPFIVTQADVAVGYLQRSVDRALLLRLNDQADIILALKAGLSGSSDEQKAFDFNSSTLRFTQLRLGLQTPLIERLEDDSKVEIHGVTGTLGITARYNPLPGQLVQVVWQGSEAQPPVLLPAVARPMPGSLEFAMPNDRAAQYDGDTVQVSYRVARTEGAVWESSAQVPVRVVALPDPQTEDFSTETPRSIRAGTTETLRYFSVSPWGLSSTIEQNRLESPLLKGMILRTVANGGWTLTMHRPVTQITFDLDATGPGDFQVTYVLANGQSSRQTYRTPQRIVFADAAGTHRITAVTFSATMYHALSIDNIKLDYF